MSETFVDLTYRGLQLGRGAKLVEVRPSTGYVELPQPMPVGTSIGLVPPDAPALTAEVIGVHEQVGGSERPPGMVVRPALADEAARAWWDAHVTLPEVEKAKPPRPPAQPPPIPQVVVVQKRVTKQGIGVPELLDDGQDTGVMDAVDPELLEATEAADSVPNVIDDGKRTTAMDAVDLAALGLEPGSSSTTAQLAAADDPDAGDSQSDGNGATGNGGAKAEGKSKKKRKRRSSSAS